MNIGFKLCTIVLSLLKALFEPVDRLKCLVDPRSQRILVMIVPALLSLLNHDYGLPHGIKLRLMVILESRYNFFKPVHFPVQCLIRYSYMLQAQLLYTLGALNYFGDALLHKHLALVELRFLLIDGAL